ncbi:MAG TPA: hypothetical protein VLT88_03780 [Desulfosarcina sp.]|nr:hypothetical protein [Desulfosarcina sp.]
MPAVAQFPMGGTAMAYLQHMLRILKLDRAVYRELAATQLPLRYCLANVSVLGLIYGLSSVQFAGDLLARQTESAVVFNAWMILMVGVSIAFLMHGGLALFVWVFSRGIGGNPLFMPAYLYIGTAAIGLWPLAPAASALQAGVGGAAAIGAAAVAAVYGAAVLFVAVKAASRLSTLKMTLASAATVVYVGCFLYLWL